MGKGARPGSSLWQACVYRFAGEGLNRRVWLSVASGPVSAYIRRGAHPAPKLRPGSCATCSRSQGDPCPLGDVSVMNSQVVASVRRAGAMAGGITND